AVARRGRRCRRRVLGRLGGTAAALVRGPVLLAGVLVAGRFAARRLARVVGDVPARALELDRGRGDELLDRSGAGGAGFERRVRELPHQLEGPVLRAVVLV